MCTCTSLLLNDHLIAYLPRLTVETLAQYLKFPLKVLYWAELISPMLFNNSLCQSAPQMWEKSISSTFHKVHMKKTRSSENQHVVLSQRPLTSLIPLQEVKTLQQHLQFKEQLLLTLFY